MSTIVIVVFFTVISFGIFIQHLVMNAIANRILDIELSLRKIDAKMDAQPSGNQEDAA